MCREVHALHDFTLWAAFGSKLPLVVQKRIMEIILKKMSEGDRAFGHAGAHAVAQKLQDLARQYGSLYGSLYEFFRSGTPEASLEREALRTVAALSCSAAGAREAGPDFSYTLWQIARTAVSARSDTPLYGLLSCNRGALESAAGGPGDRAYLGAIRDVAATAEEILQGWIEIEEEDFAQVLEVDRARHGALCALLYRGTAAGTAMVANALRDASVRYLALRPNVGAVWGSEV